MRLRKKLILASRSPRRQVLLRQLGLEFETRESGVEESFDASRPPEDNVMVLALEKAMAVASAIDNGIVIGADTIVVLEGRVLGKPRDEHEAGAMLRELSGRTHTVYTGFALVERPSGRSSADYAATRVTFRPLADEEIREYVASGSPMDKAGAYGIQDDRGAVFVEKIDGCFYNVVGFPLTKFYMLMKKFQDQP